MENKIYAHCVFCRYWKNAREKKIVKAYVWGIYNFNAYGYLRRYKEQKRKKCVATKSIPKAKWTAKAANEEILKIVGKKVARKTDRLRSHLIRHYWVLRDTVWATKTSVRSWLDYISKILKNVACTKYSEIKSSIKPVSGLRGLNGNNIFCTLHRETSPTKKNLL